MPGLLSVPHVHLKTGGDWAFEAAVSEIWDVPPAPLRTVTFTDGAAEDINVKSSVCHNLF